MESEQFFPAQSLYFYQRAKIAIGFKMEWASGHYRLFGRKAALVYFRGNSIAVDISDLRPENRISGGSGS